MLVGLPGAGKTTAGRLVAERLGAPFVDLDALIVRKAQMPVARIFGELGEPRFRELEREAMRDALGGDPGILAPGGGWAAQPGEIERARTRAVIIYLHVSPANAVRRVGDGADAEVRPLLAHATDPAARIAELLKERQAFYARADHEVRTDSRPAADVASDVEVIARREAGW